MARIVRLAMTALPLALLAACGGSDPAKGTSSSGTVPADEDTAAVEDGADANNADTDTQLLASSLVASSASNTIGLASIAPGDLATEDVGSNIHALFLPRTCATAVARGTTGATYTFSNCLGPNGLLGVSGEVDIDYTTTANSLALSLTYKGVKVNGAKLDGTATATITANGAARTMTWGGSLDGVTANGKKFSHESNSTVTWSLGDKCFAMSGSSDGAIRGREIKVEVDDYSRCGRGCPEAGGKIVVTNVAKDKSIELDFDGTATAEFTNATGRTTAVPLLCKP